MEETFRPVPTIDDSVDISRTVRMVPPSDYLVQIKSFTFISKTTEEVYESGVFEAGGYTWKLCLYPNGDDDKDAKGYISLYLKICETDTLPLGWEVNVSFKLFVYDQVHNKYLTVQDVDGRIRRFHKFEMEIGFPKLLSLNIFNDARNGYLVEDSCTFGAEVFVIKSSGKGECMSVIKDASNKGSYTWDITGFSNIQEKLLTSNVFTCGGQKWKLQVNPKEAGNGEGYNFSVCLCLHDCVKQKVFATKKIHLKDQLNGNNYESPVEDTPLWYCGSGLRDPEDCSGWGYRVMPLEDLHDKSRGFIIGDTVIIEVEVEVKSVVNYFS